MRRSHTRNIGGASKEKREPEWQRLGRKHLRSVVCTVAQERTYWQFQFSHTASLIKFESFSVEPEEKEANKCFFYWIFVQEKSDIGHSSISKRIRL